MSITIGPVAITDAYGTYEPGAEIAEPSAPLIDLAAGKACDPDTGLPYAFETPAPKPPKAAPTPAPEAAPEPAPEPVAAATPAQEAAP